MQALRYTDEGPLEGAYLYYRPVADVSPAAIGRLCICVVARAGEETETLLAVPRPGVTQAGVYTLRDISGRLVAEDAWLESASPVVWIQTA